MAEELTEERLERIEREAKQGRVTLGYEVLLLVNEIRRLRDEQFAKPR